MRSIKIVFAGLAFALLLLAPAARAGDAFITGGLQLHPSDGISASDRWLLSGGSDYHLTASGPVLLGFEIQFAKYNMGDLHAAPFNVIANLKYKGPGEKIRPVLGGGGGLYSQWNWGRTGGFDLNRNWERDFGAHGVFGVEIGGANKHGITVQAEVQHVFVDGADTTWVLLGGFYF